MQTALYLKPFVFKYHNKYGGVKLLPAYYCTVTFWYCSIHTDVWWRRSSGRKKEGDCHPGALYLTEHALMLRESTLYWSGSIGPAEGISSVKTRRSMTSVVQWTVRKPDERGAGPIDLLSLARQFLLKRLTCQSVIDPGTPLRFFLFFVFLHETFRGLLPRRRLTGW